MGKHKCRKPGQKNSASPKPSFSFPSAEGMKVGIMGGRQFSQSVQSGNAALPNVKCRELMSILRSLGYEVSRRKGSHIQLRAKGLPPVTIPDHTEIAVGTLRGIISRTGMSKEQFMSVYLESR